MLTTVLSWVWIGSGAVLILLVLLHSPKGNGMGGIAEQLVNSGVGSPQQKEQDQRQLKLWRDELRDQALTQFRAGNLDEAMTMLRPLEKHDGRPGSRLSESLKESWNRNRLQLEQLREFVNQDQWWEALSALNQLDHPWWQRQAEPIRQEVEQAIDDLRDQKEHHSHGALPAHTVARDLLNEATLNKVRHGLVQGQGHVGLKTNDVLFLDGLRRCLACNNSFGINNLIGQQLALNHSRLLHWQN